MIDKYVVFDKFDVSKKPENTSTFLASEKYIILIRMKEKEGHGKTKESHIEGYVPPNK